MSTRLADTNGSLAEALESSDVVRRRILEPPNQVLTRWVNDKAIGVSSVRAMALNTHALEITAKWWVERCPDPKTVPVDRMRKEAPFSEVS